MEITVMESKDIKEVKNIAEISWHDTYDGIIPVEIINNFLNAAYNEDALSHRLKASPFYVVKVDNKVLGFANFSNKHDNEDIELAAIYLNPSNQNQGLGSALLEYGCKQLKPNNVLVSVESENRKGKDFYLKKGFEIIEEFDDEFDGHILKTVRMSLKCSEIE